MSLPTIELLICTIGERIERVPSILLEPTEGISYIVSHQHVNYKHCPPILSARNDVKIFHIDGRGLCANRNNAISHASADLLVISDDDVRVSLKALTRLRNIAKENPQTDIFSFITNTIEGKPLHYYPTKNFIYPDIPKGFYYNSTGLVLRKNANIPSFDTRFGLGSERLEMGEEDIFIYDCHKRNLRIEFFPETLQTVLSPITTSSAYVNRASLQESKGAVLTIIYGLFGASLRIFYTALLFRKTIPPLTHLKNMFNGMTYIMKHKQK